MGGQPTEMMKIPEFMQQWIAADREGYMNFILFVTSMADFNVQDEEEEKRTAMERSIRILDRILSVDAIQNCGLLIFFNKQDVFNEIVTELSKTDEGRAEIIKRLNSSLTEGSKRGLTDGNIPVKVVHRAIESKFDNVIQKRKKGTRVYRKDTQAVDPHIMADIFNVIENEIIVDFIRNARFIM
ncbi:hypothetical protein OSTOST_05774 [Ostertagia ostertagi]